MTKVIDVNKKVLQRVKRVRKNSIISKKGEIIMRSYEEKINGCSATQENLLVAVPATQNRNNPFSL